MSAVIQFGKNYLRDLCYLSHGASLAALETYVTQLHAYSNAEITYISVTQAKSLELPENVGDYETLSMQAKILLRDNDGKLWGVMIPAPISSMFEEVENEGLRVKQAVGEQIASYYAQFSGLAVTFEEGWLVSGR